MDITNSDIPVLKATLTALEQLLAKHIFRPVLAQQSVVARKASRKAPNAFAPDSEADESRLKDSIGQLDATLFPLSEAANEDYPDRRTSESVRFALPRLLDVAIRCSRTDRTNTRDQMWLEIAFAGLAHCSGVLTPEEGSTNFQKDSVLLVEEMLQIVSIRKVTLTTSTLANIVEKYSGLVDGRITKQDVQIRINWNLVAVVLELDADVFLRIESLQNKRSARELMIPEAILEHLSVSEGQVVESDTSNTSAHLSRSITSRAVLIDRVVSPLMQAYAQRRMLDKFLQALFRHLQESYQSLGLSYLKEDGDERPNGWLIWEDAGIATALMPLVEQQLTPSQISALIDTFVKPIRDIVEDSKDLQKHLAMELETTSSVSTGLLLIKLLVESIHSTNYQDQLLAQLSLIQSNLLKLLQVSDIRTWNARWLVWRILSSTVVVLSRSQSLAVQQRFGGDGNEASAIKLATNEGFDHSGRSPNYTVAYESLSFLLSLLQYITLAEHVIPQLEDCLERVTATIADALSSTSQVTRGPGLEWNGQPQGIENPQQLAYAYLCVVVRYPVVFE